MDIYTLLTFIAASALLTILPGPDILFVITQSIASGWKSGVAVATGLCSGLIVHTSAVAFGVAAILVKYPVALTSIKIFGALYLLYLAYLSFGEKGLSLNEEKKITSYRGLVKVGFVMNILNPKVLLFFLAFLPQFVVKGSSSAYQIIVLGALFLAQAFLIFSTVSVFAGMLNRWVSHSPINRHIGRIKSAVYLLIAVNLFFI